MWRESIKQSAGKQILNPSSRRFISGALIILQPQEMLYGTLS